MENSNYILNHMKTLFTDSFLFILCAAIIFFAGKRISYYGDMIAELTGFGKAWIGLILMASITSLPELMVGISSVAIVESADLAVGDILGSCAFNLGILSILDAFTPKNKPLFSQASQSHVLAASFGLILLTMTGLALYLPVDFILTPGIGITSILFMVVYLLSIRIIFQYNSRQPKKDEIVHPHEQLTLSQAAWRYAGFALIIIGAALFLPHFAEGIAVHTGLGKSFVGTLFLAISTSLPEIAVSIAALRIGAVDMAVGNLLGSNIFNILILFIDDLFYTKGHLLKDASESNLISVFAAILMSAVVIIGLTYRSIGKKHLLAWDTMVILLIYIANIILLYKLS